MDNSSEDPYKSSITQKNAIEILKECQDFFKDQKWDDFISLWKNVTEYQSSLTFPEGKDYDFLGKYRNIQEKVWHYFLKELKKCESYETPLHYVSINNLREIGDLLISQGADVNVKAIILI